MKSAALSRSFAVPNPASELGLALKLGQVLSARVLSFTTERAELAIGQWKFTARLEAKLADTTQVYLQVKELSPEKVVFKLLPNARFAKPSADPPESNRIPVKKLAPLFQQFLKPLESADNLAKDLRAFLNLPLTKIINTANPESFTKLVETLRALNNPENPQEVNSVTLFIPVATDNKTYDVYLTIGRDNNAKPDLSRPLQASCSLETANLGTITCEALLFGKTVDCLIRGNAQVIELIRQHLPELQQRFEALGFIPRYLTVTQELLPDHRPPQIPRLSIDFRL